MHSCMSLIHSSSSSRRTLQQLDSHLPASLIAKACASAHEARQAAILVSQEAQAQADFPLPLHFSKQCMFVHYLCMKWLTQPLNTSVRLA